MLFRVVLVLLLFTGTHGNQAIKMKARTVVRRGEEGPLCDPGSELLLGGSARVVREDNRWGEEKIQNKNSSQDQTTLGKKRNL